MGYGRSLAVWCCAVLAAGAASAQTAAPAHKVQARFVAEESAVAPGGTLAVALRQMIAPGWHTYWRNPGDSGAPTTITWHLPEGWKAGAIQFPYPDRIPVQTLMNFGYEDEVTLLTDITTSSAAKPGENLVLTADVTWLVCSDVCIPEDVKLTLPVRIAAPGEQTQKHDAALFAEARKAIPRKAAFETVFDASGERFALAAKGVSAREAVFFPYTDGYVEAAAPQAFHAVEAGFVLETKPGRIVKDEEKRKALSSVDGIVVLTGADGREAFEVRATPGIIAPPASPALGVETGIGLGQALLFAFLGGLILNIMPCVLPVLSMKALALAGRPNMPAAARTESLAYGAGVLASFTLAAGLLLILRAGGEAIGWGFQLQQPVVVAGLALLLFAVGLNLSGVFDVGGGRLSGIGQRYAGQGGAVGSFFTGVLAVAVATPCTAPFMAAATGFAFTQNPSVAIAIFLILGLGFALPFALLGFSPALLRLLPRPGPWMLNFRQVLAFPMYGAAAWLVWVMAQQTGPSGLFSLLAAALALAFALWAFGASRRAYGLGGLAGLAASVVGAAAMVFFLVQSDDGSVETRVEEGSLNYESYSSARLAELRAQKAPVFVNATAAWCITCLVNERMALSSESLAETFKRKGVRALKADWTKRDPEITKLLADQGRLGVPLYLYYAPGAATPEILPQLLTAGIVRDVVER